MNGKEWNRVIAGSALVGLFAVHWLPKRLLAYVSPGLAALLIVGGLVFAHRNPLKVLWRDMENSFGNLPKRLPASVEASTPSVDNGAQ